MKNKIIDKIIFYTILVLCISAFSYFPKSYSKYIKEEQPVKFYVELDKLYMGYIQNIVPYYTSTYKEANYSIKFNRSQVMKDTDERQYLYVEIEQAACAITNVTSNGLVSINGNKATIMYTNSGTDNISVSYKCGVEDIKKTENGLELIYTNVYIYEKFMPENIRYMYLKGEGVKMLVSEYNILYPAPTAQISDDGKKMILPGELPNKYTEFESWLNLYFASLNNLYNKELDFYIKTVYNSETDILDLTKTLKGLTVTYDNVNDTYTYQIDDNFLGYARTHYAATISNRFNKIAFSNPNLTDQEANEILRYYLTSYSNYSSDEIENIMLYVEKYGSINHILVPNQDGTRNEIKGFVYLEDTNEIGISVSLLQYANSYIDQKITIDLEFASKISMFSVYSNSLVSAYDFLTDELINILTTDMNIANSIVKNNSSVLEKVAYDDYFTVQDPTTKKYILLNVYSDGVSSTYVDVIELGEADNLTITKVDNNLNVNITVNNQDNILARTNIINIVSSLDSYFETNYEFEIVDDLFTTSQTIGNITSVIDLDIITISYDIQK